MNKFNIGKKCLISVTAGDSNILLEALKVSGNCCSYHTAKSAAVLYHLSALLVIYPFSLLHPPIYPQLILCTLLGKGGVLLNVALHRRKKTMEKEEGCRVQRS